MVNETARFILVNTNIDPKMVADLWDIHENECWEYIIESERTLREAEEAYDPLLVQRQVMEWVETIPNKNNIRIEAIKEQLLDAKKNPDKHDVPSLLFEVKLLSGKAERPTPQMIQRAKEHPIENLLPNPPRRNMALCPFHNEKTPSFQIRKDNTFVCYGCNEHGDSIDLYTKLHNVGFVEAVRRLQ